MKFLFLLLLVNSTASYAQKQNVLYYLYNKDWKPIKNIASADYVVQITNIGDSLYINRIFKGSGHLWKQESFKDEEQTMPHGQFAWYDDQGRIDSSGYVNNKKKDQIWSYYDDTLGIYATIKYDRGKQIEHRDFINKTIKTDLGVKTFDEEKKIKDSLEQMKVLMKVDEKGAVFEGGQAGYKKYLMKNIKVPTDIVKTGHVKVQFIINKTGKVENLLILKSLQLSADIEAIRVLSESPVWTPAYQNGKNVIYQAIQYLTFQVS